MTSQIIVPDLADGAQATPRIISPRPDLIPEDLRKERRSVTWRYERRGQKFTKPPDQRVNIEAAWLTLGEALAASSDGTCGVGYVLGGGIVGIDLDNCISADGTLHEIARDAVETLGTYAELSPSGRGLHLLIRGRIERPRKIGQRGEVPGREIYDGRKASGRYFTVTGDCLGDGATLAEGPQAQIALDSFIAKWFSEDLPSIAVHDTGNTPETGTTSDDELLRILFRAKDGAKWSSVYKGDFNSYYPSQSEADLALCGKLRFYTRVLAPG